MKKSFVMVCLLLCTVGAYAQKKAKKEKEKSNNTPTTLRSPQSTSRVANARLQPLYGGLAKTEADEAFLAECDRNFSNRTEASKFFEARGWEYLQEGKADTAVNRFNLAWLLDDKNANAYWGLGAVSSAKGNHEEALRLLEKGVALEPNNAPLLVDVASLQLNKYQEKKDKKALQTGMDLLQRAIQADTTQGAAYIKLSMAYFYQENYDKAWEYLHQGRARGLGGLDFAYLTELIAKKEDPQGVFK